MRVERHAVGALDAAEALAAPVGQLEEAAVGGVDVEPQAFVLRHVGDRVERIDRARVRRPRCRRDEERAQARRAVGADGVAQRVGVHPELGVGRHDPQVPARQAGDRGVLRHARVGLVSAVVDAVGEVLPQPGVPGRDHRRERPHRAARGQQPLRSFREVEQRAQPTGDVLLQLHHRRARLPQADVAVEALRQELGERRRRGRRRGCTRGSPVRCTRTCGSRPRRRRRSARGRRARRVRVARRPASGRSATRRRCSPPARRRAPRSTSIRVSTTA